MIVFPAPLEFIQDVDRAAKRLQSGKLGLLGREAGQTTWKVNGRLLVKESLDKIKQENASDRVEQAIIFTGHMIDAPGRERPRFPAAAEPQARQAIFEEVRNLAGNFPASTLGSAGGANGGDILFHEVCHDLGVPTRMMLSLPPDLFVTESVAEGGPQWVARFEKLLMNHPDPNAIQILGPTRALPAWMPPSPDYDVWRRTNAWLIEEALATNARNLTVIALWDGESGNGPGGTKDLVELAKQEGIRIIVSGPCA